MTVKSETAQAAKTVSWQDWQDQAWTLTLLREHLVKRESDTLALAGIPNSRLHADIIQFEKLANAGKGEKVRTSDSLSQKAV